MSSIRIGVLGCGAIGSRYVEWLSELGHEVAAVDSDARRLDPLASVAAGCRFTTVSELLPWKPDRIVVSTPPQHHEAAAVAALESGADVLIEKPLAHELASARRIVAAASRARGRSFVVCNMRFHRGVSAVREHLEAAGRLLCYRSVFGHRLSQMRSAGGDFARSQNAGGGVIMDCIHEIDYLRWLFGPVRRMQAYTARVGTEVRDAEDLAEIIFEHESGVFGSMHFDFLMREKTRGLQVIGSDGNLTWASLGKTPERCSVRFTTNERSALLLDMPDVPAKEEYLEMLRRFTGDGGDSLQTVEEALIALELALAARAGA